MKAQAFLLPGTLVHRLGHQLGGAWVEYSHPPVYERMRYSNGTELLKIAIPGGDITIAQNLLNCLAGPFYVLYVLVVGRGEGLPGRYQSGLVERHGVDAMLARFASYIRSDGRFHLWFHDPEGQATIVWDRHNIIYAYGPVEQYEQAIRGMGFQLGQVEIPAPHEHCYRQECDDDARALLGYFDWQRSDLRPSDDE